MNTHMNPVGWFEIYVQDLERAKAFYEATFAVKLEAIAGPAVAMLAFPTDPRSPGCGGALVKFAGKTSGDGGTVVYFSCDDCAVEAARALANGGRVCKEKFSIGPHGFIALVFDTEDNLIGLHSTR
ncbi:VOC family protein [Opitutales bacterium ASA1]|uniref:VOC family protein n=1 Tax=Congregicoccus parvus TaxID=3081749 RepID=UPI002B3242EC|nr:VOC family protein [Opitutales bacterium ASA1]